MKDCLFLGGDKKTGGILVAEEAFFKSLLELEFENPDLLSSSGTGISDKCLRLFVDFCIFSDCQMNSCLFSNNQATDENGISGIFHLRFTGCPKKNVL